MDILHQGEQFYNDDWCKLREWSRNFQEKNEGSLVDIQVDDDGKFLRMFVSVKQCIDIALACGMQISAVDVIQTRHLQYRSGTIHMLTTRDSSNHLLPLAWAICETESRSTYR